MASKFYFLLMCAIIVEKSTGIELKTSDCGSELGKFSDLVIDCDEGSTPDLCNLSKNKKYDGSLKVTPNTDIDNATIALHAIIGGIKVPFPLTDNNLCVNHDVTCPLKAGQEVVPTITINVPGYAPSVNLIAIMELQSNGEDLVCVRFLGKITAGNNTL